MLNWPTKSPGESEVYGIDWAKSLNTSEAITSIAFVVEEGSVVLTDEFLSGTRANVRVSGGIEGEVARIRASYVTDEGNSDEACISIKVTACGDCTVSSTTKRSLVEQMFTECGINGWELDITPEEQDRALNRLDALMWELRGRGIDIAYNFPIGIGEGDLDDPLGCPDQAFYGLAVLGAERLAPTMGKAMSRESRMALNSAMKAVRAMAGPVGNVRIPRGTPMGSGNRGWPLRYAWSR